MNVGQVLETHLGWAANALGFRAVTPVFDGADDVSIEDALARAWLAVEAGAVYFIDPRDRGGETSTRRSAGSKARATTRLRSSQGARREGRRSAPASRSGSRQNAASGGREARTCARAQTEVEDEAQKTVDHNSPPIFGKQVLYDGRTGEPFDQPVTVGYIYMLKLVHLGGGQDPRPLHGPVLAHHPAAAGWQGAVRWPALRRDGGVGAGSLRRRPHPAGAAHREVRRRRRPREDLRSDRQGRGRARAGRAGVVQGARQRAPEPRPLGRGAERGRGASSFIDEDEQKTCRSSASTSQDSKRRIS